MKFRSQGWQFTIHFSVAIAWLFLYLTKIANESNLTITI